jgi:hypothetical protein
LGCPEEEEEEGDEVVVDEEQFVDDGQDDDDEELVPVEESLESQQSLSHFGAEPRGGWGGLLHG